MTDEMWQRVGSGEDERSVTEWMSVPGGRLYRMVWDRNPDTSQATLRGSAAVFVPIASDNSAEIKSLWEDR